METILPIKCLTVCFLPKLLLYLNIKTKLINIPTLMRELGDWLAENHRDKLF